MNKLHNLWLNYEWKCFRSIIVKWAKRENDTVMGGQLNIGYMLLTSKWGEKDAIRTVTKFKIWDMLHRKTSFSHNSYGDITVCYLDVLYNKMKCR